MDRAVYFRSLATMFRAGISIDRSLAMLGQQTPGELGKASTALATLIHSGHYLSQAMSRFPHVFTPLQRRLVQIGERSGALSEVLDRLSTYEERQVALRLKLRSALTMPAFICTACVAMVIVLPPLLFRNLFQMLADSRLPIPAITRVVMFASDCFRSVGFWLVAAALAVGVPFLVVRMGRDEALRLGVTRALMRIPHLQRVLKLLATQRFATALRTTVSVGVPLLAALELAGRATDNAVYEEALTGVIRRVKDGEPLHAALEATGLFPKVFVQGIQVGMESGTLEGMLTSLEGLIDTELTYMFEVLAAAAEPLILLVVGIIVGFVVVATLLPMVQLLQTL